MQDWKKFATDATTGTAATAAQEYNQAHHPSTSTPSPRNDREEKRRRTLRTWRIINLIIVIIFAVAAIAGAVFGALRYAKLHHAQDSLLWEIYSCAGGGVLAGITVPLNWLLGGMCLSGDCGNTAANTMSAGFLSVMLGIALLALILIGNALATIIYYWRCRRMPDLRPAARRNLWLAAIPLLLAVVWLLLWPVMT